MKHKKRVFISIAAAIIVIAIIGVFFITNPGITGSVVSDGSSGGGVAAPVNIVHLPPEDVQKVAKILLSSEFIKDVPAKSPIALTFYSIEDGQRILRDSFLIGKNQLLSEGEPAVFLAINSKYISEFNDQNLCEIIKKAQNNGDLEFHSEHGKAKLLIKYASMLKHRKCFGF